MSIANQVPDDEATAGAVFDELVLSQSEGREKYILDNAVSIVEGLEAKVVRQAKRITLLEMQVASLRLELSKQPA